MNCRLFLPGILKYIKKLLPFITVAEPLDLTEVFRTRFKVGEHTLLFRYSEVLEKSAGFEKTSTGTKYLGSPPKLFFRYRYQDKNLLQYGMLEIRMQGNNFLKELRNKDLIFIPFTFLPETWQYRLLALGDFTVNMGQGLIQWQSLAFRKSVDILE